MMRRPIVLTVLLLLWGSCLAADPPAAQIDQNYSDERERFEQAKLALQRGNRTEFQIIKNSLSHYPLYPYLEYAEIATQFHPGHQHKIDRFVEQFGDTPAAGRLQGRWLDYLQRRDDWRQYLKAYPKVSSPSTSEQCYFALALYRSGAKQTALDHALTLWNVGHSQPRQCDKLFGVLIRSKLIDESIAWQRYMAAKANGNTTLTRYLKRFFTSANYKAAYASYELISRSPGLSRRHINFDDQSEPNRAVATRVLSRYARQDALAALNEWRYFSDKFNFSDDQINEINIALIKNLVEQGYSKQADAILDENKLQAPTELIEWRLRKALAQQDWSSVRYWIKVLPTELADEQRWRYWLARAETSMTANATLSEHPLIKQLANERGYYGFLAADERQSSYAMDYRKTAIADDVMASTATHIGLIRARELYWLGEQTDAIREWRDAGANFSPAQWEATGSLFHEWGWHYIAIISMVKAKAWHDIAVRFPVLHAPIYQQYAEANRIDTQLLMAITRQESAFNEKAVSPSNAKGLMQLLPSTAKYIADKATIDFRNSGDLLTAETNVSLGSAYFRYLMDKSNDNRAISIASYNAGPNRVSRWLNDSAGALPIDIWIETIPYSETRRYVQNVLAFSVIYAQQIGATAQLFTYNERSQPL